MIDDGFDLGGLEQGLEVFDGEAEREKEREGSDRFR